MTPRWVLLMVWSGLLGFSLALAHAAPLTLSGEPATAPSPLQAKIDEGLFALKSGDLTAAEAAFNEASTLDPASSRPYLGLAEVAARRNNLQAAEAWLKKSLAAEPENAERLREWARFEFNRGNHDAALKAIRKSIDLRPDAVVAHINLAEVLLNGLKKPKEAAAAYTQALTLDANNLVARSGLGTALAAQGQFDQAAAEFEVVAKASPADPKPTHAIARLYAAQGKTDQALEALDRTIGIAPKYSAAYIEKGDLLLLKNDLANAIVAYQAATQQAANPATAYFRLGSIYQAQRKWTEAENAYLATVKHDPRLYGAYNNLAWMSAERKTRLDEALGWTKQAIEIAPKDAKLYDTLGWVHRARGELDLSANALQQAITAAPGQPTYHYHLGLVYADQGKKHEATAAFRKALSLGKKLPGGFANATDATRELTKLASK